ncbi:MAG TPA: sodium:proton exchanger [Mycobacteriales bacterium]|nr:sodium:proton exchanger [Mycobacteriales bacterium]
MFGAGVGLSGLAAITRYVRIDDVLAFVVAGLAIAVLATLVARAVDQLGDRFGAGATGVLQSALGNLPELFIGIFALRAGLHTVVETAIIGSILGNVLLVFGLSVLVGGLRNGVQHFHPRRARTITVLMLLAVAGMLVPSLASFVHSPASRHEGALSIITAVVLLTVFAASVPASLRRGDPAQEIRKAGAAPRWSPALAVVVLALTAILAALVSDWFVHALTPAIRTLHISQAFAGLVIVAIASNAVENAVGVRLAARNESDYALSVILNSPAQIALVLAPALVLLSHVIGGIPFTLVFSPLLVTTVATSVVVLTFITLDGETVWLEGAALVGLYVLIAAGFWWG